MSGLAFNARRVGFTQPGGRKALKAVDLAVRAGEQLAMIGPSGAGKTTLLNVLGAALQPDDGELQIDGNGVWQLSGRSMRALRARLFIAPQTPPLPPRQRVVTAVLAGRLPHWSLVQALRSLFSAIQADDAYGALETFALGERLWDRVDRLSGGERQRVSLARSLVSHSQALLVDEPLSALDPALAGQTLKALIGHSTEHGKTLICSLHQVDLALAHFPRIVGLRDGQVQFDLPAERVSRSAIHDLYFGHESPPDGAQVVPMAPTQAVTTKASVPAGRCA